MYFCVLLSQLLLLLHAAHSQEEKTADCDEDVSLPCPGAAATQFISVSWYKVCFRSVASFQMV